MKISKNINKNNLTYIILLSIAFLLAWFKYGIKATVLSSISLFSIFFLLFNLIKAYHYLKQKKIKELIWNFFGVILFSTIIYFLPNWLTRFATSFCAILFAFYVIYDLIKNGKPTKQN